MFFPNNTIKIYEEEEDAEQFGTEDYTGNPNTGLVLQSTVQGDFQPVSPEHSHKEFGTVVQGGYRVYLPVGTQITANSKVEVNGQLYDVKGDPMVRTTLIPHVKVLLIRQRDKGN